MSHHDEIRGVRGSGLQDLIGCVADEYVCFECHLSLLCLTPEAVEEILVMPRRQFDRGLRLGLGG